MLKHYSSAVMVDAGSLRCPGCGATAEPDSGRCRHCHARLATVSCPSCFALGFDGAAYCHKCGAARLRGAKDDAGVRCPACRSDLQRVDVGSTPLLECASCDGVWVDADVFERLCAQRESQAAVLQRLSARTGAKAAAPVTYRPCLRCGTMMNRVNFGKISGAVIDVCRGHGTFLDAGELHHIVAFIQDGGLDRARTRSIEDLKEEERRLKDLQRKATLDRRASGGSPLEVIAPWDGSGVADLIDLITGS
jgi:Zn-finger nucleic acid-binding protein